MTLEGERERERERERRLLLDLPLNIFRRHNFPSALQTESSFRPAFPALHPLKTIRRGRISASIYRSGIFLAVMAPKASRLHLRRNCASRDYSSALEERRAMSLIHHEPQSRRKNVCRVNAGRRWRNNGEWGWYNTRVMQIHRIDRVYFHNV